MVVIIIGLFAFMFACMAALYLAFAVLMVGAAAAKVDDMLHRKLEPGALPPALPRP
jgi:hypothetical protein